MLYMGDYEQKVFVQIMTEQNDKYISPTLNQAPFQKFKCYCLYCNQQFQLNTRNHRIQIDQSNKLEFKNNQSFQLAHESQFPRDRDYAFIIRRLLPPKNILRGLRINIPETCIYNQQGDPDFIIFSMRISENSPYFSIKMISGMKLISIKKLFNERRKKYTQSIYKSSDEKLDFIWNQFSRKNSDQYITIQSINNINDQIKTQTLTKKSKDEIFKANLEKSIQEAIILKFDDDNYQILSETDFSSFIDKKKTTVKLSYFQNYIKTKKNKNPIIKIMFNLPDEQQNQYFNYSKNEINQLNNEIIKASNDYIPVEKEEDFEKKLLISDKTMYLKLLTYKIYFFIEVMNKYIIEKKFYKIQILRCEFEWLQDDNEQFHFISAQKLQYIKLEFPESNRKSENQLNSSSDKDQMRKSQFFSQQQQNNQLQDICQQCLLKFYEQRKQDLGINIEKYETPKDVESEIVFNEINHTKLSFYDLITNSKYLQKQKKQKEKFQIRKQFQMFTSKNKIRQQSNYSNSSSFTPHHQFLTVRLLYFFRNSKLQHQEIKDEKINQSMGTNNLEQNIIREKFHSQLDLEEKNNIKSKSFSLNFANAKQSKKIRNKSEKINLKTKTLPFYLYQYISF